MTWNFQARGKPARRDVHVAREIDRKLRLTAAVLGTGTCKDLAAAFRRVNATTAFDIDRAHKWLQGRARPREMQVYEDWARVLDLDRPGLWLADCATDEFLDVVSARHGLDREMLLRRLGGAGAHAGPQEAPLAGTYACYSHAWSPYFRGRLVCGKLTVRARSPGPSRLHADYLELLPTGPLHWTGQVALSPRLMQIELRGAGGEVQGVFSLFPPTPPMSVLAGFMCGATIIGPDAGPSVTRIVMVRLGGEEAFAAVGEGYLSPETSIADDLAGLGLDLPDPAAVDGQLRAFLAAGPAGGLDQIAAADYRSLVALFDRIWLAPQAAMS
jgi:hypothetical protein